MGKYSHRVLRSIDYSRYRGSHLAWRKHKRKRSRKNRQWYIYNFAQQHRTNPTYPERHLHSELNRYRIAHSFHKIIGPFIVDFFFISRSLIVEVDGSYHQGTKEYDEYRENKLKSLGFKILRFSNGQVIERTRFCIEQILLEPEDLNRIVDNKIKLMKAQKKHWHTRCKYKVRRLTKEAKDSTSCKAYTGSADK